MFLFAVFAETVLGHVHDLCTRLGVLELRDVDVLGPDAGHLECGLGGIGGRAGIPVERDRRCEHLERTELARAHRCGLQVDRPIGVLLGLVGTAHHHCHAAFAG